MRNFRILSSILLLFLGLVSFSSCSWEGGSGNGYVLADCLVGEPWIRTKVLFYEGGRSSEKKESLKEMVFFENGDYEEYNGYGASYYGDWSLGSGMLTVDLYDYYGYYTTYKYEVESYSPTSLVLSYYSQDCLIEEYYKR